MFQLDLASFSHRTTYGILRSLHNMTATTTNAEKVAAVEQHQNVQDGFVLLCVLYDCYFGDCCSLCHHLTYLAAPAAITCVAALPFLGLQLPGTVTSCRRIRGYFYNEMRYINLCFTYLLTYLLWTRF